jgi:hypothetical protein
MDSPVIDAFRDALAKGSGRAHLMLAAAEPDEAAAFADALLDACLHDRAYDLQSEGGRGSWLSELVEQAGLIDRLAASVERALARPCRDHRTLGQRFELAAAIGTPRLLVAMRRNLVRMIDRQLALPTLPAYVDTSASVVLAWQSIEDALFVLRQLGRLPLANPDFRDDTYLVGTLRNDSSPEFEERLAAARAVDPAIDAYLRGVEATESALRAKSAPGTARWWEVAWNFARAEIEAEALVRSSDPRRGRRWHAWGRNAATDQLALAAADLAALPTHRTGLLVRYLSLFQRRAYPDDPTPLIRLATDRRKIVARRALEALSQVSHPGVRTLALRMVAECGPAGRVVGLLASNWEPGDERTVISLWGSTDDPDQLHDMTSGLIDVVERHPSSALVPALILAADRTPCSFCRTYLVRALVEQDALPDRLRQECRWDCQDETRVLAGGAQRSPDED